MNLGIYLLEQLKEDIPEPGDHRHNIMIIDGQPVVNVTTETGFRMIFLEEEDLNRSPPEVYDDILDEIASS